MQLASPTTHPALSKPLKLEIVLQLLPSQKLHAKMYIGYQRLVRFTHKMDTRIAKRFQNIPVSSFINFISLEKFISKTQTGICVSFLIQLTKPATFYIDSAKMLRSTVPSWMVSQTCCRLDGLPAMNAFGTWVLTCFDLESQSFILSIGTHEFFMSVITASIHTIFYENGIFLFL